MTFEQAVHLSILLGAFLSAWSLVAVALALLFGATIKHRDKQVPTNYPNRNTNQSKED